MLPHGPEAIRPRVPRPFGLKCTSVGWIETARKRSMKVLQSLTGKIRVCPSIGDPAVCNVFRPHVITYQ
jgi:hypothetical protein